MTPSLRQRILITLIPLLLLLAAIGSAGIVLLFRLGNSVNAILRENYRSVIAMEGLNEAVERIDSSFQFALSGRQEQARQQFTRSWKSYLDNLGIERNSVTVPGEAELVDRLDRLTDDYHKKGNTFYEEPSTLSRQNQAYYEPAGLLEGFGEIKNVSGQILHLNQSNMEQASADARRLAKLSAIGFAIALAIALILAGFAVLHTMRTILQPVQAVTQAALAISGGNLDQLVPYQSEDELGQLARAFNTMTRHLREFRQSQSARLLRAQRASQATVDSFPDPVIVIDSEGFVEIANPAARRLLGVLTKHHGQPTSGTWQAPEPLRQPLADALTEQRDYSPEGFDHVILLGPSGRERAMLPRVLAIRDQLGNTLGAAVLLQDVTRLRLLDQVKNNLVATASHELKTPLTSIRLAVHLLLEETVGPLTPKQTELLLDARENSERLLAMVNNLLDLARLEQGSRQLELQPVRPESLLRTAADSIRARAADHAIEVVLNLGDCLPEVQVDVSRFGSALQNLLNNALTYTDRGGRITLGAQSDGDEVELSVADTGIGIPADALPHVFEKFFRVPGQSKGTGTGLGLAIVQEIVVAHGGTITCDSHPGKGTVFRIRLPALRDAAAGRFQPKLKAVS
ncbi:MAG TPA: ATP-binding protein [Planctomycetaceae bacterium]|nr:ATP-binding protein [Planctomycetaceae bacterium]